MKGYELFLLGLAALAGGGVNALAGGGTLITFPVLTALGIPAVSANITNTVALCPGYLSGTFAQSADLTGGRPRLWLLAVAGVLGGVAGGVLLMFTGESTFRRLVPYLILFAAALLAAQGPRARPFPDPTVRPLRERREERGRPLSLPAWPRLRRLLLRGSRSGFTRTSRARAPRHRSLG